MGEVGMAAATKLAMNQLIGSLTAALSMSLGLVQQEGLDVEKFMAIVRESALYAPTLFPDEAFAQGYEPVCAGGAGAGN